MSRRNNACHRKNRRARLKKIVFDIKNYSSCHCGESDPELLTFHHVHREEKVEAINFFVKRCQKARLLNEIEKCVVLCRPCHDVVHSHLFEYYA